jgi:demethylmenaquinone methyltransferase/2-methoxy-6-polyprenyl-1,4-benzoquinol methylase
MADDSEALSEQVAYYDARAPEYEDWWFRRGRCALPAPDAARWFADVAEVEAALDSFGPSGSVLELACGTGVWTRQLARHATHLVAVDGAAATLEQNRGRLPATSKATVEYVHADLFSWRPPAEAFDAVVFGYWLSHVPDDRMAGFWQGVRGALGAGGRVFFIDSAPDPRQSEWPSGGTEERDLADGRRFTVVKRYRTPEDLQEVLASLGWRCRARLTANRMIVYGTAQR